MPENNLTPAETSPTVSLSVDASAHSLLAEWLAIEAPEGYLEENLYYTVELFRDGKGIKVDSIHGRLQALFEKIDFSGEHVFRATVQGILSKGDDKRVDCGPLQFGEVKVKNGKDISIPRVTGVFANTLDDKNSDLILSVRWDETESDQAITYSVRVVGRNSKLDATPEKNITVNLASFSNKQSGIVAGEKYTVYVSASSAENAGSESEGFEFIAGEDPDSGEDEYDAHFNANSGTAGDPINMGTGSFSYQHTDLQISGTPSFVFQTFYFSPDAVKSKYPDGKDDPDPDTLQVLGNGWSHTYMTFLKARNNIISVYWGTGGKSRYKPKAPSLDGTHYSMKGVYDGSKLFYERKAEKYILTTHAQQQYIFDKGGRLLQILSIEKNMIRLDYLGDLLHKVVKVTSADEKKNDYFELVYEDGRLKSVTDNFGRKIRYAIKNKNLESYTDPAGGSRLFTYYDKSLMKTARDQNGDVFIYNEYKDKKVVFQQDANAYALRETDKYGLSIEYSKTTKAMTAAVTDNMGNSIIYVSDSRGNLLSQEIILSETRASYRSFVYDGFNNIVRETEYEGNRTRTSEGKVTRHSYDGNLNRLESYVVSPKEEIYTGKFRYNRLNQKVADTDHLGNTTFYRFNTNHELVRLEFPLGQTETYEYKNGIVKGLVEKFTDRLGNSFRFTYERDLLISALDPYGQTVQLSDYIYGLPRDHKILDQKGILLKTTVNAYNLMGEKLSESVLYGKQPAGKAFKTEFTLDALGQVKAIKNPSGYTTLYTYNPNMKLVKTTFPAVNGVTSGFLLKYDRNDNVAQTNSGEGVTEERFSYDVVNRCIRKTDGNGNSYEFEYKMDSAAGKPFTTTQRTVFPPLEGGTILSDSIVSDILGRPVEDIGRDGQVTRKVYASAGGRLKVVTLYPQAVSGDPKTQYSSEELFDELGRLIESTDREGNKTITAYASEKTGPNNTYVSVVTETDPLKIETILHLDSNEQVLVGKMGQEESSYSYDALGRLTASDQRIRNDEHVRVAYAYSFDDGFNCLKAETAAGNAILSASYFNGMNQLVKQKNGLGTITERGYNEKGELSELLIKGGQRINYTYDKAGRNTRVNFTDQGYLTNTYDKSGNCLETTQFNAKGIETSKQTRSFDAWNRQERLKDLKGGQAKYQYNAADQLTQLTYPALPGDPGVVAVDYTYDNLQRMVKVSDWKKRVTEYAYSPDGLLLKATFSNRVVSDHSFDKAQRLTGLKTSREEMIILSNRWDLDRNGNAVKSKSLLPLAPAAEKGSTQFNYNLGNQLTEAGGVKITYDVNGNPVSLPEAGNLRFNDLNLMTQCGSDEYAYDTRGLRASSKINGKLRYYWISPNAYQAPYLSMLNPSESVPGRETGITANGSMPTGPQLDPLDQVLQITDESNKLERRFVYGLGLIAEENAAGDYLVYHFDERGSTVAMSDKQGDIANRFAYSIYGGLANHYGERSTPFLYNGQQGVLTDANNLYSMRSRFYQPGNMRFLQQDFLLGDPFSSQSLNRYAYVGGNPVRYVDPLGLERESGRGGGGSDWWKYLLASLLVVGGVLLIGYAVHKYRKWSKLRRNALKWMDLAQWIMDDASTFTNNRGNFLRASSMRSDFSMEVDRAASKKGLWKGIALAGVAPTSTGIGWFISPLFKEKED